MADRKKGMEIGMAEYANIIVDIYQGKLDKTFQYRVPERLKSTIAVGMLVAVPFGSRKMQGYVIELTDVCEYEEDKIKEILSIVKGGVLIESQMIALAGWMRENYGGTMNHALKTVLPVKEKKKAKEQKTIRLALHPVEAKNELAECERKHKTARAKLLVALLEQRELEWETATQQMSVSASVIRAMEEAGIVKVVSKTAYRNPVGGLDPGGEQKKLNEEQQNVVSKITMEYDAGERETYLIKGVTGSGKTEVYMELIAHVLAQGKQAIVLIPEIALTYQTVRRFYNRFGAQVSIINSKLSAGERYDQFERAKNGEISVMIGPRSALFTPFPALGIIIIDEEHEASYKSETVPRYHARETAIQRAKMTDAVVVLGSATPSLESYYKAENDEYCLLELKHRVQKRPMPLCEIIDLREELRRGNRSILSDRLSELMEDRLKKGEQTMLFINRRGMAGFVSCRACGHVIKCPHCDVSLSQHGSGAATRLVCHYCGYTTIQPGLCPVCGSKYISGFKAGTQKIEQVVKARFPQARVLRMDMDTTRIKDGYEQILSAFSNHEADILIGTQMIVKGHDFPGVTLVGVLAADLSLYISDYRASERTFQLLTQAAGRAGRGDIPGNVIIQTYDPDHYSITTAKEQNYEAFYGQEIEYRKMMRYPPVWNMLYILCASKNEAAASEAAVALMGKIDQIVRENSEKIFSIGPSDAPVAKISDVYRKVIYVKTREHQTLVILKDGLEAFIKDNRLYQNVAVGFDFNPVNGF